MLPSLIVTHAALQQPPAESEPSLASSLIVTLLPLVLFVGLFVFMLRFIRRSSARANESIELSRQMLAELRAIREALARENDGK